MYPPEVAQHRGGRGDVDGRRLPVAVALTPVHEDHRVLLGVHRLLSEQFFSPDGCRNWSASRGYIQPPSQDRAEWNMKNLFGKDGKDQKEWSRDAWVDAINGFFQLLFLETGDCKFFCSVLRKACRQRCSFVRRCVAIGDLGPGGVTGFTLRELGTVFAMKGKVQNEIVPVLSYSHLSQKFKYRPESKGNSGRYLGGGCRLLFLSVVVRARAKVGEIVQPTPRGRWTGES